MDRFSLATPAFEGPLEALLDLIEGRKLSITTVSLAEVTDAYLAYIEQLPELPLAETSQFVLIASTLLLIKSRTLLPSIDLTVDERESVEELERRLARLRLVRTYAKILRAQWGTRQLILARRTPLKDSLFVPTGVAVDTLRTAVAHLIETLPRPEKVAQAAVAPVLALEEVIVQVRERLTRAFRAQFSELTRARAKHDVIVYFLAMLELVRSGSASVSQDKLFSDITIEIANVAGTPSYGQ